MTKDGELHQLEIAFAGRGLTFRHRPGAQFAVMRWQAGIAEMRSTRVPHRQKGKSTYEFEEQIFHLLCCSSTRGGLIEKLNRLEAS